MGFYEHGDKPLDSQKQINMTMNWWRKSLYNCQVDNFIHYCSVFYYIYQVIYTHACTHTWIHPCTWVFARTHARARAHAHAHTHTHTHTYLIILHKIC